MVAHIQHVHSIDQPCMCPHDGCSLAFKNFYDARRHAQFQHRDTPRFYCKHRECTKSYLQEGALIRHQNSCSLPCPGGECHRHHHPATTPTSSSPSPMIVDSVVEGLKVEQEDSKHLLFSASSSLPSPPGLSSPFLPNPRKRSESGSSQDVLSSLRDSIGSSSASATSSPGRGYTQRLRRNPPSPQRPNTRRRTHSLATTPTSRKAAIASGVAPVSGGSRRPPLGGRSRTSPDPPAEKDELEDEDDEEHDDDENDDEDDDDDEEKEEEEEGTEKEKFACHICKRPFSRLHNLDTHVGRVHRREKKHECEFPGCFKRFGSKGDADRHNRIHYPDDDRYKPFVCHHDGCGQRFPRSEKRDRHQITCTFRCSKYGCRHP